MPRIDRTKRHLLVDILTITICAVISNANTWEEIEGYGKAKYRWFKKFLSLPHGIPSHDTFARVFARLDPEQLQKCFLRWVGSISEITAGENEITAIPQLLKALYLEGCLVTKKEAGHGREETRFYRCLTNLVSPLENQSEWPGLKSLAMAEFNYLLKVLAA